MIQCTGKKILILFSILIILSEVQVFAGLCDVSAFRSPESYELPVLIGTEGAGLELKWWTQGGNFGVGRFGETVSSAGDVNGDGIIDIIVGDALAQVDFVGDPGCSYVFSGADGSVIHKLLGDSAGDWFGRSVSDLGDINGDGKAEFIVGAWGADPGGLSFAGSAYVYSGADGTLIYQKNGGAAGDRFGQSVASVGDLNADGIPDFIIGAHYASPGGLVEAGSAYVYSGADGTLIYQKNGGAAGDRFGRYVSSVGDLNADGIPDFAIVGNSIAIYSGADSSLIYQKNDSGQVINDAGDVNGDGRTDFITGASGASPGGLSQAGSAYVYSGVDGSLLYQKNGGAAGDYFGNSVSSAGDVDGDGKADFVIGAFAASPGGLTAAGSVYVYSGEDGNLLYQKNGATSLAGIGWSIDSLGDMNGNGKEDIIVGAFNGSNGRAFTFTIDTPTIVNNQSGDDVWRNSNIATYNIDFSNPSGLHIDKFQVRACSTNTNCGDIIDWTDVATGLSPADFYTIDWSLPISVWNALPIGTSYISVKLFSGSAGVVSQGPAFYVKKDTLTPLLTDNQTGDNTWRISNTATYDIDFADAGGALLEKVQVRACSTNTDCGDVIDWTDAIIHMATDTYTADWLFPSSVWNALPEANSYISVQVYDGAGNATETGPLFYVIKDTASPTISITSPSAGSWNKLDFNVAVSIADATSGLALCEYRILSNSAETRAWTAYTCTNSPQVTVGSGLECRDEGANLCEIQIRATDVANNTATQSRQFSIDFSTPTAGTVTPANHATVSEVSDTFEASTAFSDGSGSGIASCEFYCSGGTGICDGTWRAGTWNSGVCSATGLTCNNGNNLILNMRAADAVGFAVSATETTRICDTQVPQCTFNNPSASSSQTSSFIIDIADVDTGSGVTSCEYMSESYNGGWLQTRAWTSRTCNSLNSASISVGSSGDCKNNGSDACRISVRSTDALGYVSNVSTRLFNISYTPDLTPPSDISTVNDGLGSDVVYSTSLAQLSANWTASSDTESGVARYWYSIGTSPGGADIVSWTDNGLQTSITRTGMSLNQAQTYFVSVKAENGGGLFSNVATSNGQTVDATRPQDIANVNDGSGSDVDYVSTTDRIAANWSASFSTPSGISRYWYAVGTTAGGTNLISWTDNGLNTSFSQTGLTLNEGQAYYVSVKAENGAGLMSSPVSSDGVTVDTVVPSVSISSPNDGAVISGSITVNGSVSVNVLTLQSWNLYYGPGTTPTAWKEIVIGTSNVSNGALGTWNTTSLDGNYMLKLVATTKYGRVIETTKPVIISGNANTVSGTIPVHQWILVSAPVNPVPSDPISMYGTNSEYKVFRWNPEKTPVQDLGCYEYPATLVAGSGYWIRAFDKPISYSYSGTVVDTTQDNALQIKTGWNQIGTPFNRSYPWGQVQVRYSGSVYNLTTAANMGLISPSIYSYDNTGNTWVQNDSSLEMQSQVGYAIRAYNNVELLFGPGSGMPGGLARLARLVRPSYDYRINLMAAAVESSDNASIIGAANIANDDYDTLDAEEPPQKPEGSYVSLYFQNDHWMKKAGRYNSDIRSTSQKTGQQEDWVVNVETNEVGQTVTLTWDSAGLPADKYSFTFINTDTGERINMAVQDTYSYTAVGSKVSTNHFKIEVVKLTSDASTTMSYNLQPGWNMISVPIEPEVTSALAQLSDDLPLFDIYQFYDGQFYENENADIQTGFGYWIYVKDNAEIDVSGIPAASQVQVPLKPGWNVIGNPYDKALSWDDSISLECSEQSMTLSQAIEVKAIDATRYQFSGDAYSIVPPASPLEPWKGYFIKATQDCELILSQ